MKKTLIIIALFMIFTFVPQSSVEANAESLDDTVKGTLDNIDLSGYEELIALLGEYNGYSFAKTARQLIDDIINGNAEPTFAYFVNSLLGILGGEISGILPQLIIIVVISLLYGVLKNLNSGFLNQETQKIVYLVCYALIITVIAYMFVDTVKYAINIFGFIQKFSDVCFPVLITLISALGASSTVAVYQPFVLVFSNVLMKMVTTIIMPLFYITFIFGIVGNLSDNLKLDKFSSTAKSIAEWAVGIVFGTFITLLTAQGITGASFDGLAMRGAKYALSSYVPVVGSYLKDGFDIVVAGCVVIKNAVGLCALLIILTGIIVPIVRISVLCFGLKITSAIAEPISDGKIAAVLSTSGESLKVLTVAIICAGVSMIVAVMLIIYTCNPGGL